MYSAAEGKSTLGIPKKVGAEFADADPGGKLPEKVKGGRSERAKAMYDHPRSKSR